MILLETNDYHKVIVPLKSVTINCLFAHAIVENIMPGWVYVDDKDSPKTFYIIHPYGLSLLFGAAGNEGFNREFCNYCLNQGVVPNRQEWLQVFPDEWNSVLAKYLKENIVRPDESFGNKGTKTIELHTRVNFKFNLDKYQLFKENVLPNNQQVVLTDKKMFEEMRGEVIPSKFWATAEVFLEKSIGFSLVYKELVASTSYGAFIRKNKLEIGLETIAACQGMGFAQLTCSTLIAYCIKNDYEPVWACRLCNIGSYNLAQKLGFEPTVKSSFYKLGKPL